MRSLTNQLIFDHPKAYAIVKNLNAQEIEDNLFCSEKDIESNSSSQAGQRLNQRPSTGDGEREFIEEAKQETVVMVASNKSFQE